MTEEIKALEEKLRIKAEANTLALKKLCEESDAQNQRRKLRWA